MTQKGRSRKGAASCVSISSFACCTGRVRFHRLWRRLIQFHLSSPTSFNALTLTGKYMKFHWTHLPLLVLFILSARAQENHRASSLPVLRVIPAPQHVELNSSSFKITSQTRIVVGDGSSGEDAFAAEQINLYLNELNVIDLKIVKEESLRRLTSNFIYIASPRSEAARRWLKERNLKPEPPMKEEGYILSSERDGVFVIAESARGRFYGVMSLLQMIEKNKKSTLIPGALIRDWPLQKMRGITDDLSRGQVSTISNFKKIIRFLARHKLNVYSPYIEDIFSFKNHPLIGKGRGALTPAEIKELDVYAKKHHVELIPIFETLGHWENILVMPEYVKYGEFPGAHTVNVSDEAVYRMLDEMIGELAAAFSSPHFNMAADESWDVGLGVNKERVAASDLATVHAEHYKRLVEIIKKHKKKPMMYGDIILNNPTILDKIPKDIIIVDWHYGVSDKYGSPEIFKEAGFPYVVSPAVWNFTGPFPNYINTFVNIQNLNRDGYLNGSLGLLTSNWNDHGGEALRELNYYGYAWTAECAWQPLKADQTLFNERFFMGFFGGAAGRTGQLIYTLLSSPLNQMNWHELWRHPLLPLRESSLNDLWRVQSIRSTMPLAQSLLSNLKVDASRNQDQVPYLEFITRLNQWFARKLAAGEFLKQVLRDTSRPEKRDSLRSVAVEECRVLITDLVSLKSEFQNLWTATNRPANLQWLLMRYDRQASYWQETIDELMQNAVYREPTIESSWIYHPQANPGKRDTTATQIPRVFLRKTFTMDEVVSSAKLQLIGDSHAKLWINGTEVGEVYARRSLSLIVEHQRVKMWDVAPYLRKGNNLMAVEVASYSPFGSGGTNVYLELQHGDHLQKIVSDTSWKASTTGEAGWRDLLFDDRQWVQAAPKPYRNVVIRPNFERGRLSWIEQ